MDENNNSEIDWTRLVDYLAEESTPAERQQVEQWIAADAAHQRFMRMLQRIWSASQTSKGTAFDDVDLNMRWKELGEKITERGLPSPTPKSVPQAGDRTAVDRGAVARRGRDRSSAGLFRRVASVLAFVVILTGSVILLARTLRQPDELATTSPSLQEVVTEPGQRATLRFADGTRVRVNVDSELRYSPGFTTDKREVYLQGEAYFEVARDEARTFVVHAEDGDVEVLGTTFAVRNYDDEASMQVVVVEGSVSMQAGQKEKRDTTMLRSGHLGRFASGKIQVQSNADLDPYIAWTDGRLVFRDASLDEVATQLERWYRLQVDLEVAPDKVDRLNASFGDEPLSEILNSIATALHLQYEWGQRSVTFYAKPPDAP